MKPENVFSSHLLPFESRNHGVKYILIIIHFKSRHQVTALGDCGEGVSLKVRRFPWSTHAHAVSEPCMSSGSGHRHETNMKLGGQLGKHVSFSGRGRRDERQGNRELK